VKKGEETSVKLGESKEHKMLLPRATPEMQAAIREPLLRVGIKRLEKKQQGRKPLNRKKGRKRSWGLGGGSFKMNQRRW